MSPSWSWLLTHVGAAPMSGPLALPGAVIVSLDVFLIQALRGAGCPTGVDLLALEVLACMHGWVDSASDTGARFS